jgi:hypothetical protein
MKKAVIAVMAGSLLGSYGTWADEAKAPSSWADQVTLKGDFRLRHESIEQDGKEDRDRQRIRARAGLEAKPSSDVTVGIRLSTSQEGDPVSSNQTLGEGFSRKDVYLDLGYLDWHPESIEGLSLIGGKMENPFAMVGDLVWDGDLNPEGIALKQKVGGDGLDLLLNAGAFSVEERSATTDDATLLGGQVAAKFKSDAVHGIVGAGYYYYDNLKGFSPVVDPLDGFGNSIIETVDPVTEEVTAAAYATGFELVDLIAEVGGDIGVPAAVYGNFVQNQDADEDDTGYMLGLKLGKTKEPGSVDFNYNYRELEANAVLGAFSDSDFIGGGTDGKGHKVAVGVQLTKVLKGQVTYFMNEIGLEGDAKDYDRLQIDVAGKF